MEVFKKSEVPSRSELVAGLSMVCVRLKEMSGSRSAERAATLGEHQGATKDKLEKERERFVQELKKLD